MRSGSTSSRRTWTVAGVVLSLALLGAACTSTKSNDGTSAIGDPASESASTTTPAEVTATPTAVSTAPARPSAGCQEAATADGSVTSPTGALEDQKITVDGVERTYRIFVPPSASPDTPMPLVLNIHGLTSNIVEQVALTQFEPLAATEGFFVVTPQGAGDKWGFDNTPKNADLPFFNALLDQLEAQHCVDTARVYSTGISNGGMMSATLACQMGDRIAAVGLVSGIREPDNCQPPDTPIPMMVFWGTKDVVLPFYGGLGPGLKGGPLVAPSEPPADLAGFAPVEQVVGEWVSHDGCDADPTTFTPGVKVEERVFTGCTNDAQVRFFVITDAGHNWPGSKVLVATNVPDDPYHSILGNTTDQIDATALIWQFFKGYALTS